KWARKILPDFNPEKAGVRLDPNKRTGSDPAKETAQSAKRQRSTEGEAPQAKKRKAQPQPSNRWFAEVTKGRTLIGVLDKGSKDGLIPKDLWRRVVNELHGRFVKEMLRCGEPPPECKDAGWYQGSRLRRQVVLTLNEETVKALERTEHRLKYGFEHVSVRIYKSDAKAKPGGIGLESDTQEPTEEGHPEGMSDEEEDILEGYTSEESDLARALSGVGMEEDSLLSSETEAEITVVEICKDVPDDHANKPPSQ
ncbi:hypothetical protein KR074_001178, partial [Drosophila pseudoananassae]